MINTAIDSLDTLRLRIREFACARAWERYHTPKNLVMALSVEAFPSASAGKLTNA